MKELLTNEWLETHLTNKWLETYLTNVTGEYIKFIKEYPFGSAISEENGVMKVFSSETYSFNIYYIGNKMYVRDGERVEVKTLEDLDRLINKQIGEHYQI